MERTNSQPRFVSTQLRMSPTTTAMSSLNSTPTSTNNTEIPAAMPKTGMSILER